MNEHIADQRHLALVDTIRAQQAQITRLGLSVLELSTLVQMLVRLHDGRLLDLEYSSTIRGEILDGLMLRIERLEARDAAG